MAMPKHCLAGYRPPSSESQKYVSPETKLFCHAWPPYACSMQQLQIVQVIGQLKVRACLKLIATLCCGNH